MSPAAAVRDASPSLRSFEAQWRARAADGLAALRADAMGRVLRLGLPTTRDESWRYTDLRHVAAVAYSEAPAVEQELTAARWHLLGEGAVTLPLVNGRPRPALGSMSTPGVEIETLKDLSRTQPDRIACHLGPLSDAEASRWSLLNTALFEDGWYLRLTGTVAAPIVILHLLTADEPNTIAYPRVIIDAAPGSNAKIVEHFVHAGADSPLCNSASHIAAGRGAHIEHYRIYDAGSAAMHLDSLTLRQSADSHCRQFTVAQNGDLVRTALDASLDEPGARLDSFSLLVGADARHLDCMNVVSHKARDTHSTQTARAIGSGTSRVIFNSKVVVAAGARQADSQQSCRGLLLSASAEIDARPQLEIHTDEVKCAHGASVGRLDPDMLFYLLSRGLDRETAQTLLVYAFLADVLRDMSLPAARAAIEKALIAQLPDPQTLQRFR